MGELGHRTVVDHTAFGLPGTARGEKDICRSVCSRSYVRRRQECGTHCIHDVLVNRDDLLNQLLSPSAMRLGRHNQEGFHTAHYISQSLLWMRWLQGYKGCSGFEDGQLGDDDPLAVA
ncbi:hypothetical protein ACMYSQ_006309 [Aspergillus niger]